MSTADIDKDLRSVVLTALHNTKSCGDSPEVGRACRSCEATAVTQAVTEHLIAVLDAQMEGEA